MMLMIVDDVDVDGTLCTVLNLLGEINSGIADIGADMFCGQGP